MTTTKRAAGYVFASPRCIIGTGPTERTAYDDAGRWMDADARPAFDDVPRRDTHGDAYYLLPATADLLADVERRGGDIAWSTAGGIADVVVLNRA